MVSAVLLLTLQGSLPPVDESRRDPVLPAFLANLRRAVEKRDAVGLMVRMAPKVRTSFGDGGGKAVFRKAWRPENPDAPIWRELESILKLGGAFQGQSYWMPTTYAKWPEALDSFSYAAAIGPTIPVRATAADDGKVVARLNYSILKVDAAKKGWFSVRLEDGVQGFVRETDLRRPIDYRMGLGKVGGRWLIQALVKGD